ncbi:MAG: YebC/PmpR family DNA-binding transcriptional regulator [Candidatus Contendobacter sp.]|jgi:YebC/PmpR family DNA-binding regulatory protein|nr:YebC/PmpR family DNA-binding transcriptional regulator [Candidatus Contendobacter sp.]
MAGHSKWANIQHRKNTQDAKRGKLFTRLIREITVATRMSGSDSAMNPRLRLGMDKALAANMPRETIDRAIKRGAGALDGVEYEEIRYEGYGPSGVAVIVDTMTDNRNRTVAEVRHAFSKSGGNMGTSGSVAFQFTERGVLSYPAGCDEDRIMEVALEAGADDVVSDEDGAVDVLTEPATFQQIKAAMTAAGLTPDEAEVTMRAGITIKLGLEDAQKMIKLLDLLEDLDDTQNVYSNADIPDDVLAKL